MLYRRRPAMIKMTKKLTSVLLIVIIVLSETMIGPVNAASKKRIARTDNLYVRNDGDFSKDTIKVGNKIYYTLDDTFYCYNVKTRKKSKIIKLNGRADSIYYSNKCFYVVLSDEEKIKEKTDSYTTYFKDVYKLNLKKKTTELILDDIDIFIGYSSGSIWFVKNNGLTSTINAESDSVTYGISDISRASFVGSSIYLYVSKKDSNDKTINTYFSFNPKTCKEKEIDYSKYNDMVIPMATLSFPEKNINNGGTSSICRNLTPGWKGWDAQYFNDDGIRKVQTFKNKKKITFYKGPKKKVSQVVCIFDKYVVVRVSSKKESSYVLLNKKGKKVGNLGSEKYDFMKKTRMHIKW